jgi:alpha-ketoglutarate-dependent taurine dioxygenase
VHERHPPGITHLHNDTVPEFGGDLVWASGYAAYSKLSPEFRKLIDGKKAIFKSGITFPDRDNPSADPKTAETIHPIVRVHPATGWKSLYVNRDWMVRIVGFDKAESDLILNYLCDVYETNPDIQVRFKWSPGSSALFDNRYVLDNLSKSTATDNYRITLHTASWDYENMDERHGTKVTTLGGEPYFDEKAPTRREALGLNDKDN